MSKVKDTGAALAPERILNGDVSLFWIGIVTKSMMEIFEAHGLRHYQVVGQKHVKIAQGDLVLIEGWEKKGLDEIFSNAKAAKTDWWEHVSIAEWTMLDYRGYERLLATLEQGKLADLASYHLLPTGIHKYLHKSMKQMLRDKIVFNARGIAQDEKEPPRVIAALDLLLAYIENGEEKPAPRKVNVQRNLTEKDLTRVFHTKDLTSDLFPDGCWLPTTGDINAAFESMKSVGFKAEEGDDEMPATLQKKLAKVKTEGKKRASGTKADSSKATGAPSSSKVQVKAKVNPKSKKHPRVSDSDEDEDQPVAKKPKSDKITIELDDDEE